MKLDRRGVDRSIAWVDPIGKDSMTLRLTKHHGLGNDFLVALVSQNPGLSPDARRAVALCDRRFGIGADGVLWGLVPDEAGADLRMVLHNADGSEAEISGNGIRCLAQAWTMDQGRERGQVVIDTAGGRRVVDVAPTEDPLTSSVLVDMGAVTDGPALPDGLAPTAGRVATFSIGNPHVVIEVPSVAEVDISSLGPEIEGRFAGGINVHALEATGPGAIRLVHWERGAGVTLACGSGASVAAVAAHRWGLTSADVDEVTVEMPGGQATVCVGDTVELRGPATFVGDVTVP
jgi:diaminopimelate epimerase